MLSILRVLCLCVEHAQDTQLHAAATFTEAPSHNKRCTLFVKARPCSPHPYTDSVLTIPPPPPPQAEALAAASKVRLPADMAETARSVGLRSTALSKYISLQVRVTSWGSLLVHTARVWGLRLTFCSGGRSD